MRSHIVLVSDRGNHALRYFSFCDDELADTYAKEGGGMEEWVEDVL